MTPSKVPPVLIRRASCRVCRSQSAEESSLRWMSSTMLRTGRLCSQAGVLPSSRRSESASRWLGLRGSSGRLRRLLLAGSHARQTRKLVLRVSSCRSSRTIVERWSLPRSCTTRESSSMRLRTPVFLLQWPKWLRCRISRLAVGWRPLPKQR